MADAKPRKAPRVALGTALLLAAWLFGVWPPPVWWRTHWPRCTAMMRLRAVGPSGGQAGRSSPTGCPPVRPTALHDISPLLQRMVIVGEDSRFWTHHGIDLAELADALGVERGRDVAATLRAIWRRRDRLRGASTITQQLAKNLYLSPSRSALRKVKEAVTALRIEVALPKTRILELYLDVAEWGPGVWGAQAASRTYFGVPASQLDERAAAALAATLPHPHSSNPAYRPEAMVTRRDLILARYHGVDVHIPQEEEGDTAPTAPRVDVPPIESLQIKLPAPVDRVGDTERTETDR
jgi:monofunctional biosynthetic peptidoglycan transglycosylase